MISADLCKCGHSKDEHSYGMTSCDCGCPWFTPDRTASEVPDLQAAIERVLGEHTRDDASQYTACRCGWQHIGGYLTGRRPHTEHLAERVIAYLHRKGDQ